MERRRIVFLEFNELCPPLLARWMEAGKLPNFLRFYRESDVFTAAADTDDRDSLEPWIQWYSVHTGLDLRQHGVRHLTDGPAAQHPDIWRMLLKQGLRVGNCASMNAGRFQAPGSFYLPDPWCTSEAPHPTEMEAYQRVVASYVQENSTAGRGRVTRADYARFVAFMASHGLSMKTVAAVAGQAWSEARSGKTTTWRRAPLLDLLQFDLFRHYWSRLRPHFSTFFINSTAHYQHAYWHCAFPEDFSAVTDLAQAAKFRDAILYGYQRMDALLERFMALERDGALLILTTGLSQQANQRIGRMYFRPVNVNKLLGDLGIRPAAVMPVMSEQFSIRFESPAEAHAAQERLAALHVAGEPVFDFAPAPERTVFFGALSRPATADGAALEGFPNGSQRFGDVFRALPHLKSGVHHPDSVLWLKLGRHEVHREKVSILDIVPTVLEYFGVDRVAVDPEGRLSGASLFARPGIRSREAVGA
jgi:hypothetical protein